MRLRFLTAGESHGPALVGILDGLPAGLWLLAEHIERDLQRRKLGYGRGGRMAIEPEKPQILAGVRHGRTLGTPLALLIENADHPKAWASRMAVGPTDDKGKPVSLPRPGHADLTGSIKFGHRDLRNSLERTTIPAFYEFARGETGSGGFYTTGATQWGCSAMRKPPMPM